LRLTGFARFFFAGSGSGAGLPGVADFLFAPSYCGFSGWRL
jgi:hypothetical protein